ncbi:MAG: hypothetical protein ACTHJI_00375 [Leifsonia sp.]
MEDAGNVGERRTITVGRVRGVRWKRGWLVGGVAIAVYLAAVVFGAVTHQPTDVTTYGTTVIGKHHDGQDWQLDVISGRHSWTLHVDHGEYESYQVGDNYNG